MKDSIATELPGTAKSAQEFIALLDEAIKHAKSLSLQWDEISAILAERAQEGLRRAA